MMWSNVLSIFSVVSNSIVIEHLAYQRYNMIAVVVGMVIYTM